MFANRIEAGRQLAGSLAHLAGARPLVLGLPRGGVVVAAEVARALAGELDVLLVKKIGAPDNPELALAAVTEDGQLVVNEEVRSLCHADAAYLDHARTERLAAMAAQRDLYRAARAAVSPAGRTVVVVDDGLATGATMIAAVQALARAGPARLEAAVPVAPPETVDRLAATPGLAAVTCVRRPAWFDGVGQFYRDFTQVSDAEVVAVLRQWA